MKKILSFVLAILMLSTILCSCASSDGTIVFEEKNITVKSTSGLGVEWGVYEDTNKLATGAWERITSAVDRLNPSLVRCMTNFDWFVSDYDSKDTDDLNDDTWSYNFDNKYFDSTCNILDYCQENDISVAFGVWNVIGSADESVDVWKMIPNATSDIRWAKMVADLMEYLVKIKGYTCIKWFVNSNEPNYTGVVGSSKNAYNTYEKWEQGVKNVRQALDNIGLTDIDIVGGDVTAVSGYDEYLYNIAKNLQEEVNNYGYHVYISNAKLDNGDFQNNIKTVYNNIKEIDKTISEKPIIIWEAGLLDGKNNVTDGNGYIANYSYGIRMADYTVQALLSGVTGVCYWDLDDAMHFMYTDSGTVAKQWGMFSTLASASALMQEYRPWYHSSTLLSNLVSEGSKIYASNQEAETYYRTMAVVSSDNTSAGIVAINRSSKAVTKTFRIEETISAEENKLYFYIFNEQNLRLDENGFVTYNYCIDGSINNNTTIEIPANSFVIVSTRPL